MDSRTSRLPMIPADPAAGDDTVTSLSEAQKEGQSLKLVKSTSVIRSALPRKIQILGPGRKLGLLSSDEHYVLNFKNSKSLHVISQGLTI